MTEEKDSTNLDELYSDPLPSDDKIKSPAPSSGKRKNEVIKISAPKKKKPLDEDDMKDEETLKKEEAEKKEYILKIEDACQPDLLGNLEEIQKMRKELKLQTMTLKELKKAWSRIMTINGSDHPRHFIYQMAIGVAKKAENILSAYPQFSAPGFGKRLEQNPLFRQKLHMWALDYFNHTEMTTEMTLAYSVLNEYQQSREVGQKIQQRQEIWGNLKVAKDIEEKFADL
jgi:hypothetical protein